MTALRGQQEVGDGIGQFNALSFLIQQRLGRLNTCTLVRVVAVASSGDVAPAGFVDVQPLVNQVDGNKNATPHGVIHDIPYFRLQGGANAVIIDPEVGDIGLACFADRDIASVVANKAPANPGSGRRFAMRDALYVGAFLGEAPTQFLRFSSSGISLVSAAAMTITAPGGININGVQINAAGAISAPEPVTAPDAVLNGISFVGHRHGGVATGGGQTGTPI